MSTVIKVENLSKRYRLGVINRDMLYKDLQSRWAKFRGKEDPNAAIGLKHDKRLEHGDEFWALRNVDLEVKEGEILGVVGRNGAGKSTLLKILSQITAPTEGRVKVKGRIASLLEVGTGFHPELTGRENVFLNGAILGMTRREVRSKFDEIVSFAGIEEFIDTPVKRYSSGMYVRLAFAVAAHLDPEILIVDEVLAVGDAEFQKRCLGKMRQISRQGGRTILFVSHNMEFVTNLCNHSLIMERGKVSYSGPAKEAVFRYLEEGAASNSFVDLRGHGNRMDDCSEYLTGIRFNDLPAAAIAYGEPLSITLYYNFRMQIQDPQFAIIFSTAAGNRVLTLASAYQSNDFPRLFIGSGAITCRTESLSLLPGKYYISLRLWKFGEKLDDLERVVEITVNGDKTKRLNHNYNTDMGCVYVQATWNADRLPAL